MFALSTNIDNIALDQRQSIDSKRTVFDYQNRTLDGEYKSIKAKLKMSMQFIVDDESDEVLIYAKLLS